MILAGPLATWWLLGPNPGYAESNDPTIRPDEWYYMVRPPTIDPHVERLVGIAAFAVAIGAAAVLISAGRRGRVDPRWWAPLGVLFVLGISVGVAARIVTAAVIGANLGGGFIILISPMLLAGLVWSLARMVWILRKTRITGP